MPILPYKTASSCHKFSCRAGLIAPAGVVRATGLGKLADQIVNREFQSIWSIYTIVSHIPTSPFVYRNYTLEKS